MKFENTEVFNFEGALRGMRNPMESWAKSDSERLNDFGKLCHGSDFFIGDDDKKLAQTLIKAGSDHRKFMRQIFVCVDITAPLYWWKEFDTYKVGTVANSTSTMHKLATTAITFDKFEDINKELFELGDDYITDSVYDYLNTMEKLRRGYCEDKNKTAWKLLIKLLPESWLQKRTVTMTYENLFAIAHSDRKNHKLTEWCESFFDWMKTLPYAEEFIFLDNRKSNIQDAVLKLDSLRENISKGFSDDVAAEKEITHIIELLGGIKCQCQEQLI